MAKHRAFIACCVKDFAEGQMQNCPVLGLPDIRLVGRKGQEVNPRDFAGHELIVLFCPSDLEAAKRELAEYNSMADALAYNDAYMIALCDPNVGSPASRVTMASDPSQIAWGAFNDSLPPAEQASWGTGAVFLIGRGGCLNQSWRGVGHAQKVREALSERM
jgi:peroxiredoxin